MARHKHADLIHAWAEGATIQHRTSIGWRDIACPSYGENEEYRIKPEKKPDVVRYWLIGRLGMAHQAAPDEPHNLKLTFSGDNGGLINTEIIK